MRATPDRRPAAKSASKASVGAARRERFPASQSRGLSLSRPTASRSAGTARDALSPIPLSTIASPTTLNRKYPQWLSIERCSSAAFVDGQQGRRGPTNRPGCKVLPLSRRPGEQNGERTTRNIVEGPYHGERTKGRQGRGQGKAQPGAKAQKRLAAKEQGQRRPQKAPARARAGGPHLRHNSVGHPNSRKVGEAYRFARYLYPRTCNLGRRVGSSRCGAEKGAAGLEQAAADQIARVGDALTSAGSR